jgi:DNA-binding NarL/FixJ family response regulator
MTTLTPDARGNDRGSHAPPPTRVLIVEDEALIAAALRDRLTRLGMEVIAAVDTAQRAFDEAVRCVPDVVLMDVRLKGAGDGIDAAVQIRNAVDVPIVFVTAHADRVTLERAKATMPYGFVRKPYQQADLQVAIEMAVDRHCRERQAREAGPGRRAEDRLLAEDALQRYDSLTSRERQVFAMVVHGKLNKEIASALGTSERTIKAHRARVMDKMGVASVAALTRVAALLGM